MGNTSSTSYPGHRAANYQRNTDPNNTGQVISVGGEEGSSRPEGSSSAAPQQTSTMPRPGPMPLQPPRPPSMPSPLITQQQGYLRRPVPVPQGGGRIVRLNPNHPQQPQLRRIPASPGAFHMRPTPPGTPGMTLRVEVPLGVSSGQEFQVFTGSRIIRVRCPPFVRSGQTLHISVPAEPLPISSGSMAALTPYEQRRTTPRESDSKGNNGSNNNNNPMSVGNTPSPSHNPNINSNSNSNDVLRVPNQTSDPSRPVAYQVTIPPGVRSGQQFTIRIENQELAITCPPNLRPGMQVRVMPPRSRDSNSTATIPPSVAAQLASHSQQLQQRSQGQGQGQTTSATSNATSPEMTPTTTGTEHTPDDNRPLQRQQSRPRVQMQMFQVAVPPGMRPGQNFTIIAGQQRVMVTCPTNSRPGQLIRFQLPVVTMAPPPEMGQQGSSQTNSVTPNNACNYTETHPPSKESGEKASEINLRYDTKDGWTRTIRLTDFKFQWIRKDAATGNVLTRHDRFEIDRSAYVRQLTTAEGADPRMRTGTVCLVPACDAVVDSSVVGSSGNGEEIVGYADITSAQTKTFKEKVEWFQQDVCQRLRVEWFRGHVRVLVRREFLLMDSMQAVMSLGPTDLRKTWRFEFIGEAGVDGGGLAREWFQLVSQEIFNADRGLWSSNQGNQMCMQINGSSEMTCGPDHLIFFRFLGRVMGKALFDRQLISGHMVRHLYKHILGWPVTFHDLELIDEQYYQNMKNLLSYTKEELEALCLDFTYTEQNLGTSREIELVEGGKNIDVTIENLPEYLEACVRYRLLGRIKHQLTELLLGFFDLIPEPLLTVFDYNELELLMCGVPEINMEDWKNNTEYLGLVSKNQKVIRWFWDVVENEFDEELKAKLLQFATGTSGVPSSGFGYLQGNDGNIRKFSIQGVDLPTNTLPRSHTCFNRIDLPLYSSREELRDKLKLAVQESLGSGFHIE